MAMAIDSQSQSAIGSTVSSVTWTHTCAAGAILVVIAHIINSAVTPTCTYNTVAMTRITGATINGTNVTTAIFYMLAPASGANSIVLSAGATVSQMMGGAISFTGANTTTQPDGATATQFTPAAAGTHFTLTTTESNATGFLVAGWTDVSKLTPTFDGTQMYSLGSTRGYYAAYKTYSSTGSNSQFVSMSATDGPAGAMAGFQEAAGGAGGSTRVPLKGLLGVGT